MPPRKADNGDKTSAQANSQLRADFRAVFRNPDNKLLTDRGRAVLLYLRRWTGWASTTYRPDSPLEMAFRDGRRSVYLEIQRILNLSDEAILKLDAAGEPEDGSPETGIYGEE